MDDAAARFDDADFEDLSILGGDALADVSARGASLAPMVDYSAERSAPSLVVAWDRYADPARDGELAARLGAAHPLFVPVSGKVLAR